MTSVPEVIKQIAQNVRDKSVPEHIRFNYEQVLRETRDYCDRELKRK